MRHTSGDFLHWKPQVYSFRRRKPWNGGAKSSIKKKNIPRDPGSPCQMMIGVYNHLRNARFLGSMKPFSVSVIGSLGLVFNALKRRVVCIPKNKICRIHGSFRSLVPRKDACDTLTSSISRVHVNRCYI